MYLVGTGQDLARISVLLTPKIVTFSVGRPFGIGCNFFLFQPYSLLVLSGSLHGKIMIVRLRLIASMKRLYKLILIRCLNYYLRKIYVHQNQTTKYGI